MPEHQSDAAPPGLLRPRVPQGRAADDLAGWEAAPFAEAVLQQPRSWPLPWAAAHLLKCVRPGCFCQGSGPASRPRCTAGYVAPAFQQPMGRGAPAQVRIEWLA